ncbi:class C sortase [Cellulosimicrobium cellulans]|uniref:class C sortase n=1 Tax=Cellulosimicrobium cellulans TaxID=1710 RepID=UPI0036EB7178
MTHTLISPKRRRHVRRHAWRAAWPWSRVAVVLAATIGVAVLLYPTAAAWSSARVHATEVSGYVETVASIPDQDRTAMLRAADAYNDELPNGPLRDPYAITTTGEQTAVGEGADAYFAALDTDDRGTMGRIRIPTIDVDLPIHHGTDDAILAAGIGHLYGSALPVGGAGTHSVLTGHSGLPNATLFTHINQLDIGDEIFVQVLDRKLVYQVDQILTVEPTDTEALRADPDKDYLTLVTCAPIGVNTHRLLVRAERVSDAAAADAAAQGLPATADDPGFPWWALAMIGAVTVTVFATRPRRNRTRPSADSGHELVVARP